MKLLTRKYQIQAPIDHVFFCFTDNDYFVGEINRLKDGEELQAVVKDEGIELRGKEPLFRYEIVEINRPFTYQALITPIADNLIRFGEAGIKCDFKEKNGKTVVLVEFISNKSPGIIWRLFIKFIVLVTSFKARDDEKLYIRRIEESA